MSLKKNIFIKYIKLIQKQKIKSENLYMEYIIVRQLLQIHFMELFFH